MKKFATSVGVYMICWVGFICLAYSKVIVVSTHICLNKTLSNYLKYQMLWGLNDSEIRGLAIDEMEIKTKKSILVNKKSSSN